MKIPNCVSFGRIAALLAVALFGLTASSALASNRPTISSFTPTSGAIGTSVTVNGTHLTGTTTVKFNGTSASFTVVSSTSITTSVPTGATTGTISVTTGSGTATSAASFTVTASPPTPTISSFTPTSGAVGTGVTVTGTNFTGASAVKFNGTSASFTVVSSTSITTSVPTGATTGTISVTTGGGTATSAASFTVTTTSIPTDFVAAWLFPGNALDSGPNHIDGTIFGATTTTDRFGRVGNAYAYDGVTNYIEVPDNNVLSISTTGKFTVSMWMRPDTLQFTHQESSGYVNWMGKGTSNEQEWMSRMYSLTNTENRPNRTSFYVFNLAGGLGAGSYVEEPVTVGVWLHYVATVDVAANAITWYKNSVQRDQDTLSGYNIVPANGTAPLRFGTRDFASFFQGAIDDVRIYNRVLTLAEIQALYNESAP